MRTVYGHHQELEEKHTYIIGQTGTGKSTLLKSLIYSRAEPFALIDPHGVLTQELLGTIPAYYFDATDSDNPPGLNPLIADAPPEIVIDNTLSALKTIWADSWGDGRMQYVLYHALWTVINYPHRTLLAVHRVLTDDKFRAKLMPLVPRETALFWTQEYGMRPVKERLEWIAPIQNRIGQFVANPILRNIIGQVHPKLDLRRTMDSGKNVLFNVSKSAVGHEGSRLLGSLLVAEFELTAFRRTNANPYHLYIDEFQNYTTDSFPTILSECRKYGLFLTLAHQYIDQLPDGMLSAILGNCGNLISFRVSSDDAETLSGTMGDGLHLLPNHTARLNGTTIFTEPPVVPSKNAHHSRSLGVAKHAIEDKHARWSAH